MAKELNSHITIQATPEQVWQAMITFENFPKWNPLILSITGEAKVGNTLTINVKPANRSAMTFKPKVLKCDANKELRWLGSGPIKGLFDGEHYFIIHDNEDGTVKFEHGERFSGILVPLMPKLLKDTELAFEQMNVALKTLVEKQKVNHPHEQNV